MEDLARARRSLRSEDVRDAIIDCLSEGREASVGAIVAAVIAALGRQVLRSAVRSYLAISAPGRFERTRPAYYRLMNRGNRA